MSETYPRSIANGTLFNIDDVLELDVGESNPRSILDYAIKLGRAQAGNTDFNMYAKSDANDEWFPFDTITILAGDTTSSGVYSNGFRWIRMELATAITGSAQLRMSQ